MKTKYGLRIVNLMAIIIVLLGNALTTTIPAAAAASGTASARVTPSNASPSIGNTITVDVNIDVSGVNSPDNKLGSYTSSLNWNTAVLSYVSYTGAPPSGFTGSVNTANTSSGSIAFNGANAAGTTGNILVVRITFNVVGGGTSPLDLSVSAMSAAGTFNSLLSILTVNDSSVTVQSPLSYNVPLLSGWNLVSFNLHPGNTVIASVLANIAGQYDLVYAWNAANGTWMKYDPNVGYGNMLSSLDETQGFWIKMKSAQTLNVSGTAPGTSNIALKTSWNLVGYPSQTVRALPDVFNLHGVGSDFTLVYTYQASDTADPWKKFDQQAISGNDLLELSAGLGFWIKVGGPHTWDVSY